jgi:hypothetical protein
MAFDVTAFSNWTVSFLEVTGSTVYGPHHAVLVGGGAGVGSFDEDDALGGEQAQDAEAYGAPGIVFRPRPPEDVSTPDGSQRLAAEAMAARTGDGLVPMAWRDLRFNRVFPAPKPGTVALVGYGGGFLAFDDTAGNSGDQKATLGTLYVPYQFSGGVPAKAMVITVDPETEALQLIHGDGFAISMTPDEGIVMRADAETFARMKPGEMLFHAAKIMLKGNVYLGAQAEVGVPLLAGGASPPCPTLYLSPV